MRQKHFLNKLTTYLFYASILFFLIAFNFQDSKSGGWYQQFLPTGLPNFQVSDMFFLDSLTGWIVTGNSSPNDTSGYILKTSNGGDNWNLQFTDRRDFSRVKFINSNTGFVSGGYYDGARLYKTTNGGNYWFAINGPGGQIFYDDMSVLNEDIIWISISHSLTGGAFLTTNGGSSWQVKYSQTSANPSHIYMYNVRIGFIDGGGLKKTTNGGDNWISITSEGQFVDMYFVDSLTGWKTNGGTLMKKTTNGGLNWITQSLPSGGNIILNYVSKFTNINRDTIWSVGGTYYIGGGQNRGMIMRTTNGGNNWYYQIPDTSIHIPIYYHTQFVNNKIGWAHLDDGVHTITGGDSIFVMSAHQQIVNISDKFKLEQNYPNPFNPKTVIGYSLLKNGYVKIIVYNVLGKEIATLVNEDKEAGKYETQFSINQYTNNGSSSGIYFYSLFVDGVRIDTKKAVLIK